MEINLGKWEEMKVTPFDFKDSIIEMVDGMLHHISVNFNDCYYFDLSSKIRKKYDNRFKVDNSSMSTAIGDKIYIFGGKGYFQEKKLICYDTCKGTWEPRCEMPSPLKFSAISVIDNLIYLFGGYVDYSTTQTNIVLCYDTTTDMWSQKANMPTLRNGATSTVVNGKIYVFGGYDSLQGQLNIVECYDPVNDTWERKSNMPNSKECAASVAIHNDVYIVGGRGIIDTMETYCYDTVTDIWTIKADLPLLRTRINPKAFNIDNKIYLVGGIDNNFDNATKIFVYTP